MLVKQVHVCVARSLVAVFAVFFSLFFPDLAVAMPRKMWPAEAEKFLIEEWHTVLKSTQGVMMTKAEKVDLVLKKLNARSKENEWDLDLSTDRALEKKKGSSKLTMSRRSRGKLAASELAVKLTCEDR